MQHPILPIPTIDCESIPSSSRSRNIVVVESSACGLDRKLDAADWGDPSTPQRQEADRAYAAEHAAALRLAKTKPRTPAGAAEVLAYIVDEMDQMHGQAVWHAAAIGNIAAALRSM
jgi:hypothetical protein